MKNKKGITLIELLIVVAIMNILFFVAIPSYENYIKDAHSDAVKSQMFDISTDFERIKSRFFSYKNAVNSSGDFIVDTEKLRYPLSKKENPRFILSVSNVTESSYTILATPTTLQGSAYGKIKLEYVNSEMRGYHDVDDDDTWAERWY